MWMRIWWGDLLGILGGEDGRELGRLVEEVWGRY